MTEVAIVTAFGSDVKLTRLEDGYWHGECILDNEIQRAKIVVDMDSPSCTPSGLKEGLMSVEIALGREIVSLRKLLSDQIRWEHYRQENGFGAPYDDDVPILNKDDDPLKILGPMEIEIAPYSDRYLQTTLIWNMPWSAGRVIEVAVLSDGQLRYGR